MIEAATDSATWEGSAIKTINDEDAAKYLEDFAAKNVLGFVEPDADYNTLMASAAGDIQSLFSVFEGNAIFYPGENITLVFENGTTTDDDGGTKLPWLAEFSPFVDPSTVPNITTGQQLFDWFVLGIDSTPGGQSIPSDVNESDTAPTTDSQNTVTTADDSADNSTVSATASATDSADQPQATADDSTGDGNANENFWDDAAYPNNPIVSQPNLGQTDGGYVTGYVLNDGVTGILSIPSFFMTPENADTFSTAVRDFLVESKKAGCTRVIIDLQRNLGGSDLLATDTFKQFFPDVDPFNGGRLRAYKTVDSLGNTFTQYYQKTNPADMDPPFEALSASAWVAPVYINAETNANFTSWGELYGPHPLNGDQFTTVQRDNLSSVVFTEQTAGIVVYGFANETVNTTQPYPAKDVILLTDGLCSYACARFVEMMKKEGGARTVVAGGRPRTGPMQAASGNRGALPYTSSDLDVDIDTAGKFNASVAGELPQNRSTDFVLTYASFNLKDSIRKGSDKPLQFTYEAADCRIFYTTWTVYNYINLWNYVIDALYRNPSLCVAGSTNVHEAPKPAPSTVGGLIMAGLNPDNPPTRNAKRSLPVKRSLSFDLPSPEPIYPRSPLPEPLPLPSPQDAFSTIPQNELETSRLDAPFDLDACAKGCTQSQTCFQAPVCKQGKLSTIPSCADRCNLAANIACRGAASACHQKPGTKFGVCVTPTQNQAQKECGTKTGPEKGGSTKGPNPALKGLAYSRGGRRPGK